MQVCLKSMNLKLFEKLLKRGADYPPSSLHMALEELGGHTPGTEVRGMGATPLAQRCGAWGTHGIPCVAPLCTPLAQRCGAWGLHRGATQGTAAVGYMRDRA